MYFYNQISNLVSIFVLFLICCLRKAYCLRQTKSILMFVIYFVTIASKLIKCFIFITLARASFFVRQFILIQSNKDNERLFPCCFSFIHNLLLTVSLIFV